MSHSKWLLLVGVTCHMPTTARAIQTRFNEQALQPAVAPADGGELYEALYSGVGYHSDLRLTHATDLMRQIEKSKERYAEIGRDVNRASRRSAQRRPRVSVLASLLQELQTDDDGGSGIADCAVHGTILGIVATNLEYYRGAIRLAEALEQQGVGCIVVSMSSSFQPEQPHRNVRALQLPLAADWRAEPKFCADNMTGWRHASVLKTQLMRHVFESGYSVMILDCDWVVSSDQLRVVTERLIYRAALSAQLASKQCSNCSTVPALLAALDASRFQVVAPRDSSVGGVRLLNIGLLWVRRSNSTVPLVERTANRSVVAWDQAVFNQELTGQPQALSRCCYSEAWLQDVFMRPEDDQLRNDHKTKTEQEDCDTAYHEWASLQPPKGESDVMYPHWDPNHFNDITMRESCPCTETPCTEEDRLRGALLDARG